VALGERSYEIEIGSGNLSEIGGFVAARLHCSGALVVTDEHVRDLYAHPVATALEKTGVPVQIERVRPGEASKSVASISALWQRALEANIDRSSAVVAVGGGVVGDLAGFLAASYARGIPLIQVPTTLLAQVDSSVGGKVGINLPQAKNMVGHFWQPRGVLIDTDVLTTLPVREYRAGLAEVVKYGVILDADFFALLEAETEAIVARQSAILRQIVARCCRLKADVVERDEREETGLRAVLNYGHTFAHALEAAAGYGELLHGEAVAIGMLCASRLAARLGRIGSGATERQYQLLSALGLPTAMPDLPRQQLLSLMAHDKKTTAGRLRFVLPSRLGHVELVDNVPAQDVLAAMSE